MKERILTDKELLDLACESGNKEQAQLLLSGAVQGWRHIKLKEIDRKIIDWAYKDKDNG